MSPLDSAFVLFVHGFANRLPLLDAVGIFFASYFIFALALAVFVLVNKSGFFSVAAFRRSAYFFAVIILPVAVNAIIGIIAFRERPFAALDFEPLIAISASSKSFPSDHTAVAFALAALGALVRPRWAVALFFVAFLIGAGRIYAGIHYPSDIIVGALVGSASAYIIHRFYGRNIRTRA